MLATLTSINPETNMKRWDADEMLQTGKKLFASIHKRKHYCHANHDVHLLAREINTWLPQGVQALKDGSYSPRCLKRYYFNDEVVDQLYLSDRIFQHVLLQIVKPTFKHIMSSNCYHLAGPNGVKQATDRIRQILQDENPAYFIRADIKSFYKSIPHFKLIQDIKKYYDDPKLIAMLVNIITNPIDTPFGYKNPINGIALRGPLSQFFSGIYLKPLDDTLSKMSLAYLRFQDDILILCKTKRQMLRARRRMMEVLQERHLSLSGKKTRMGAINDSFHFLGIQYSQAQTENNSSAKYPHGNATAHHLTDYYLDDGGG